MPPRKLASVLSQSEDHLNRVTLLDPKLWSALVNSAAMTAVQVKDPVTEGEGRSQFTTYEVETSETSVRRRYSDFQWLYKRLLTEVPGAVVPIIPHKRTLKNDVKFNPTFIEERRGNLQTFLAEVLSHEDLKVAPSMTPFMTAEMGDDFVVAKETVEKAKPHVYDVTDQEEMPAAKTVGKKVGNFFAKANTIMQVRTGHVEIEQTKEDPEINVIREYITELEAHVKYLVTSSQALAKSTMDNAEAIHDLGVHVAGWKSTHLKSVNSGEDLSVRALTSVIDFSDECHDLIQKKGKAEERDFVLSLQRIALDLQAVQVALKTRRGLQVTYTTKLKQINDKDIALDKATKALRPPEVTDKIEADKASLMKESSALKQALDECSIRLIRDASRIQPKLTDSLQSCLHAYACIQIKYSQKLHESWKLLLPNFSVTSKADVTDNLSQTFSDVALDNGGGASAATKDDANLGNEDVQPAPSGEEDKFV